MSPKKHSSIIEFYNVEAPYVTEFRRLLHNISTNDVNKELKTIMMTSAMLSEGKSTVCSFLAITAAVKKGKKTLLIDSDLRRPTIHKIFQLQAKAGLKEILADGYNTRDAISTTEIDKLDVLTAGGFCENPSQVFDADAMGVLLEELKFYYDLIIIDAAPLLPVSDPMLLASKVDGVLMVVKAGATQKEVVRRAVEILNPRQNNLIGIAFNNMNHSLPYYYDYGYYQYEYDMDRKKGKKLPPTQNKELHKRKAK